MMEIARTLRDLVANEPKLRAISDELAARRLGPGTWSIKEILGHLVDSAANNHQRFVRLQLVERWIAAGYEQDGWTRVQHYQEQEWQQIIDLWVAYNRHLAHLVEHVDPAALSNVWQTESGEEHTLEFLIEDYVRHAQHHIDQILQMLEQN